MFPDVSRMPRWYVWPIPAYNLTRVMNIIGVQKLIEAIGKVARSLGYVGYNIDKANDE